MMCRGLDREGRLAVKRAMREHPRVRAMDAELDTCAEVSFVDAFMCLEDLPGEARAWASADTYTMAIVGAADAMDYWQQPGSVEAVRQAALEAGP